MNEKLNYSLNALAMRSLKKNPAAWFSLFILAGLYLGAIFADFISPYSYDNENRLYSYCPPTRVNLILESGRITAPFVYDVKLTFDDFHRRIYGADKSKAFPIKFLVKGDRYKFLGIIPCSTHLFGLERSASARLYLWGADSRGRDIFSRLLYGSRVSLSVGLLGVAISFGLGLLIGGFSGYYGGKMDNLIMRLCEMIMLVPAWEISIERGLEVMGDDEYLEVTPKNVRLRKHFLNDAERAKAKRKKELAAQAA